jgi:16S rRNA (guanine527-N7)-methyltransferase
MKTIESTDTKGLAAWQLFIKNAALTEEQAHQFKRYLELLLAWNEDINLTSIESVATIISHHFQDSLAVAEQIDFKDGDMICDVGSGGGFPGIPLKIKYPFLRVVLIEVVHKKVHFLNTVIKELGLQDIEVCSYDWRTFLRKTSHPINYFFARASLRPDELIRLFSPGWAYSGATLVYWASRDWQMGEKEASFFIKESSYSIDHKKRRLVFFAKKGV